MIEEIELKRAEETASRAESTSAVSQTELRPTEATAHCCFCQASLRHTFVEHEN